MSLQLYFRFMAIATPLMLGICSLSLWKEKERSNTLLAISVGLTLGGIYYILSSF